MDELNIEATSSTPQVVLDKDSGTFKFQGKSFPEDSRVFYTPVFKWLEEYVTNPNEESHVEFKLEYFNSSSSLIILEILNLFDKIHKEGKKVSVAWNHLEIDEDMLEAGEEYADLVSIPFEYNTFEESE